MRFTPDEQSNLPKLALTIANAHMPAAVSEGDPEPLFPPSFLGNCDTVDVSGGERDLGLDDTGHDSQYEPEDSDSSEGGDLSDDTVTPTEALGKVCFSPNLSFPGRS